MTQAPLDPTESLDTDGDSIGDNADPDRDGDGIPNIYDPAPDNGFDPVITFTNFDPFDTNTNKAPLPEGFGFPSDWTIEFDDLTFETTLASKPIESGLATVDLTRTLLLLQTRSYIFSIVMRGFLVSTTLPCASLVQ